VFWLATVLALGLAVGLRRRVGVGTQVFLVFCVTAIVGAWYFGLTRGA
jgi:hypothetical protein